jgi:inorganic pyrophosphatase
MESFEIIIETPKDCREKYKYDASKNSFELHKILPLGMSFPYDFGFIPSTKGEDGDPLDAMVISEFKSFPGTRLECRLIGALLANQTNKNKTIRNDRYFFIPKVSILFKDINEIADFPLEHNNQLKLFFTAYNKAEGKEFAPIKILNAEKSYKFLKKQKEIPPLPG